MKEWMRRLAAALCACALLALSCALAEQGGATKAQEISRKCSYKVSDGDRGKLTDGKTGTAWSNKGAGSYVGVKLPDGVEAGWLRVEWMFDPDGFELTEYDASMNSLRQRTQDDTFPSIYMVFDLLPEAKYLQLKMTAPGQRVCAVRVYSRGDLPSDVQKWNPQVTKADLMVLSTHQDDELIFLGGTIPYYATALKKPTIVVYMTNCARYRRAEALNALWKMGVRDYPEFINLPDEKVDSINAGISLWGGKDHILSLLVERIRRFKPEVIVTQDLNGEYGHNQHKITARAAKYAIDAAADPEQYPDSYRKFGAWQVKKLYHHLYKENQIEMDWETPMDSLKGYTPLKVAQIGMREHSSQTKAYSVKSHGTYDNSKFGLYFTTVGPDVAKNDFLENIEPDASERYLAEHPEAVEAASLRTTPGNAKAASASETADTAEPEAAETDEVEVSEVTEPGDGGESEIADDAAAENEAQAGEELPESEPVGEDAEPAGEGDAISADALAAAENPDAAAEGEIVDPPEDAEPASAAEATHEPSALPPVARETGGGAGLAVAMIAAGVAVAAGAGWYAVRALRAPRGRKRRRRR